MPIPFAYQESTSEQRLPNAGRWPVAQGRSRDLRTSFHYGPRFLAHGVDALVVLGAAQFLANAFALLLLAAHASGIRGAGSGAAPLMREAFWAAQGQLFPACVALLSLLYFVALPLVAGKTLGLGLVGLEYRTEAGERPDHHAMAQRFFCLVLVYATGGMLALAGLRSRRGWLIQDYWSRVRVVPAEE